MFAHPATEFFCRHCNNSAGLSPETCYLCGPICSVCFDRQDYPCNKNKKGKPLNKRTVQDVIEKILEIQILKDDFSLMFGNQAEKYWEQYNYHHDGNLLYFLASLGIVPRQQFYEFIAQALN